jgi:folate-dependent tRNA-U54 methylase TrmFO/GidA
MNSNWGIVPPLPERVRDKKEKARIMAERGLAALAAVSFD